MDTTKFVNRHVGITAEDLPDMLKTAGVNTLDELIDQTIPANILEAAVEPARTHDRT